MADIDRALAQLSSRLGEVPPELSDRIWSRLSGEPVAIATRRAPRRTLHIVFVAAALAAGLAAAVAIVAVRNPPSEPAAGTTASVQPPPATTAEIPPVVLRSPLVDADLPRDWTPITWHLDAVVEPSPVFAAASFPIVAGPPGDGCTPTGARAQMATRRSRRSS